MAPHGTTWCHVLVNSFNSPSAVAVNGKVRRIFQCHLLHTVPQLHMASCTHIWVLYGVRVAQLHIKWLAVYKHLVVSMAQIEPNSILVSPLTIQYCRRAGWDFIKNSEIVACDREVVWYTHYWHWPMSNRFMSQGQYLEMLHVPTHCQKKCILHDQWCRESTIEWDYPGKDDNHYFSLLFTQSWLKYVGSYLSNPWDCSYVASQAMHSTSVAWGLSGARLNKCKDTFFWCFA